MRLWKNPPSINVTFNIPPEFKLVEQKLPALVETTKPNEEPLPFNILEYISMESELTAQDARKRRAREIYKDSQDWNIVLRMLEMEDNPR